MILTSQRRALFIMIAPPSSILHTREMFSLGTAPLSVRIKNRLYQIEFILKIIFTEKNVLTKLEQVKDPVPLALASAVSVSKIYRGDVKRKIQEFYSQKVSLDLSPVLKETFLHKSRNTSSLG